MSEAIVVTQPGMLSLIQDLGRPGYGELGVSCGGAADRASLRLGNRILGNSEKAAAIEILLGNATFRAEGRLIVAVTGAPAPITVDGRPVSCDRAILLPDGATLCVGTPEVGARTYLAVRGGIQADRVLGSAATDPTSGLGPARLRAGDRLRVRPAHRVILPDADLALSRVPTGEARLRLRFGPREDWFTAEARELLLACPWEVTDHVDRVGVRLAGPTLQRAHVGELQSEGVVRGSIQVPADGQPLVFGADHPTTGGYPVIACALDADTDLLGQLRPGDVVRFIQSS